MCIQSRSVLPTIKAVIDTEKSKVLRQSVHKAKQLYQKLKSNFITIIMRRHICKFCIIVSLLQYLNKMNDVTYRLQ